MALFLQPDSNFWAIKPEGQETVFEFSNLAVNMDLILFLKKGEFILPLSNDPKNEYPITVYTILLHYSVNEHLVWNFRNIHLRDEIYIEVMNITQRKTSGKTKFILTEVPDGRL